MPVKSVNICIKSPVLPRLSTFAQKSAPVAGLSAPRSRGSRGVQTQSASARTRQPYSSGMRPVWMPVMVSYSFWVTGPMLPSPMVMTSSM